MVVIMSNGAIVKIARTDFNCPHCKKHYTDDKEIYYKKICKAKDFARVKCKCGKTFGLTADMTGDTVAFAISTPKKEHEKD